MPIHRLPDSSDLEQLRKQAKQLRRSVVAGEPHALELVTEFHPRPPEKVKLADTQLVIARMYGFPSWPKLVDVVATITRHSRSPHRVPASADLADEFLRLACLTYGADYPGRTSEADDLVQEHPELATANVCTMAATASVDALAEDLAASPELARRPGGPFAWEPLLYLTYSRLGGRRRWIIAARTLLAHGADANAGYLWEGLRSPFTALTGSFGGGEGDQPPHPAGLALARVLLEAGADANDSQTLYNLGLGGSWRDDTDHLELLFDFGLGRGDGGPWKARLGPTLQSPAQLVRDELATAALRGGPRRTRLLLERGAEVDGIGAHPAFGERTPLELALLHGHPAVAKLLAAAGGTSRLDEAEALIAALMGGDADAVTRYSADDVGRMRTEHPELINHAAEHGSTAAVEVLVANGWDVNHRRRTTPLHNAAWNDDVAMSKLLIALGADPTIVDTEHDATALGYAEYGGKHSVAAYLRTLASERPDPQPRR